MTVSEMAERLELETLTAAPPGSVVKGCYIGDLLSWVMGRASEGDAWITVMGNVNAIAVAKLAGVACIVLCDGAPLDSEAREKAEATGVAVLRGKSPAYGLAVELSALL